MNDGLLMMSLYFSLIGENLNLERPLLVGPLPRSDLRPLRNHSTIDARFISKVPLHRQLNNVTHNSRSNRGLSPSFNPLRQVYLRDKAKERSHYNID